ncbi:MAG: hypothetical protein WCR27_02750 [Eubacteriales bacterium]
MVTDLNKVKIIKDSVHGYIEVDQLYISNFINTPHFQRLRRVEQTSMRVLYPSARHDRFIHSIGTYYLGNKAFTYFQKNYLTYYGEKHKDCWEKWGKSFGIACLLHDIGHAPFPNTCEIFFAERTIFQENKKRKIGGDIELIIRVIIGN